MKILEHFSVFLGLRLRLQVDPEVIAHLTTPDHDQLGPSVVAENPGGSNSVAVGASPCTGVLGAVDGDPLHCHGIRRGIRLRGTAGAIPADHTTLPVLAVICLATVIRSAFGFGAGCWGALGMNGPPLLAYGTLRHWPPERFRATLQGYFLPASLVGMAGYWVAGLWVPAVTRYYLTSLPVVLAATALGRVLNRHMDGRRFLVYVHVGLVVIGGMLLIQSVWGSGRS